MKKIYFFQMFLLVLLSGFLSAPSFSQYSPGKVLSFLEDTANQKESKLRDLLIQELSQYINTFPDTSLAGDACCLLASVYNDKGKKADALAALYKGLYLYPEFSRRQECIAMAQDLIAKNKDYQKKQEKLLTVLAGPALKTEREDRYITYLRFLMDLDDKDMNEWIRDELRSFITQYPADTCMYSVLQWNADLFRQAEKWHEASNGYQKLQSLYPDNPNLPYAIYHQAKVMYEKLDQNKEAVQACRVLYLNYPQHEYAPPALFMSAEIKTKKLKDHAGAAENFRQFLDTYPDNEMAAEALMAIGDLNRDKLDNPTKAIATYDEFVAKFRTDLRGAEALEKAANIYKDKLKDYSLAAEYYAKIADLYRTHQKAPDMLIKAGELCEDKMKDYVKAIYYYQMVLDKFADSRKVGEAKKKIEKARTKI
ncbi:MAG TPA: tetratricopeptide repeat protein [bacterium]|nr:tetratricopeptide repeat protein [bacterium]